MLLKPLVQITDDGARLEQPLALAIGIGDLEAGHLDGASAFEQVVAVLLMVLRIKALNGQGKAPHFLAHLDAKRTGGELVQHQVLALLVDGLLRRWRPHHTFGPSDKFPQLHEGAKHDAQGSEKGSDDGFHG